MHEKFTLVPNWLYIMHEKFGTADRLNKQATIQRWSSEISHAAQGTQGTLTHPDCPRSLNFKEPRVPWLLEVVPWGKDSTVALTQCIFQISGQWPFARSWRVRSTTGRARTFANFLNSLAGGVDPQGQNSFGAEFPRGRNSPGAEFLRDRFSFGLSIRLSEFSFHSSCFKKINFNFFLAQLQSLLCCFVA